MTFSKYLSLVCQNCKIIHLNIFYYFCFNGYQIESRHSLHSQAVSERHQPSYGGSRGYQTQDQFENVSTRRRPDLSRFDEREERDYT